MIRGCSLTAEQGTFQFSGGGSNPTQPLHAKQLKIERCEPSHAIALVKQWHSRLPNCMGGGWMIAFRAHYENITYAVALWGNCSSRILPQEWMELRRMACAPNAPRFTASRTLAVMTRLLKKYFPACPRVVSYQDCEVHTGTIYKAAGWQQGRYCPAQKRNRGLIKKGGKLVVYRSSINGEAPDIAAKIRWEKAL